MLVQDGIFRFKITSCQILTKLSQKPRMVVNYLLPKDCQLSLFTTRAGENLSFLFVSIHLQAGGSDLFSMVSLQARIQKCLCCLVSFYLTPG